MTRIYHRGVPARNTHTMAAANMLYHIKHTIDDSIMDIEHEIVLHGYSCKESVLDEIMDLKAELREDKANLAYVDISAQEYSHFKDSIASMLKELNALTGHLRRLLHDSYHGRCTKAEFIQAISEAREELDEELVKLSSKIKSAVEAHYPSDVHSEFLYKSLAK